MTSELENPVKVQTDTYITEYFHVDEKTRYVRHFLSEKAPAEHFEIWPQMWMFSFGMISQGTVKIRVGESTQSLEGNVGVLIPPRSPLTWVIEPKLFESEAVFSLHPFPSHFLADRVHVVEFKRAVNPKTVNEVIDITRSSLVHNISTLEYEKEPEAMELKQQVECRRKGKDLSSLAGELSMARETLSRKFKQYFGVSPLAYQNRLKVSAAFENLIFSDEPSRMTEVLHDAGFESFSSFNKQFKKFTDAPPSAYNLSRDRLKVLT